MQHGINEISLITSTCTQDKWLNNGRLFKTDKNGYESLAEVLISRLLKYSNLEDDTPFSFMRYRMESITVNDRPTTGCSCEDFLQKGQNLINLDDLLKKNGINWDFKFKRLHSSNQRLNFLIETVKEITGLEYFPQYISLTFEIDALFLNNARSIVNIYLIEENDKYLYCPIHNNSAGLLSNTKLFPLDTPPKHHISKAYAQPLGISFNRQLAAAHYSVKKQLYLPKLIKRQIMLEAYPLLAYYPKSLQESIGNRICETLSIRQRFM